MNRKTILAVASMNLVTLFIVALMLRTSTASATPLLAGSLSPQAGAPGQMTYQGYLSESDGSAMDKTIDMAFGIYTDPVYSIDDVPVWSEAHDAVAVGNGYFHVTLGATNALTANVFASTQRWLQVILNANSTSPTYLPRQPFLAVPYAFQASNADTLDGLDSTQLLTFTPYVTTVFGSVTLHGKSSYPLSNYGLPPGVKAVLVQFYCNGLTSAVCYLNLTDTGPNLLNVNSYNLVATALIPVQNDTLYVNAPNPTDPNQTSLSILGYFK
ncbi:MAG: hypothetical protein ACOYYS_22775 [Chloroflexota bacterium]